MKKLSLKYKKVITVTALITFLLSACNFGTDNVKVATSGKVDNEQSENSEETINTVEEKNEGSAETTETETKDDKKSDKTQTTDAETEGTSQTTLPAQRPSETVNANTTTTNSNKGNEASSSVVRSKYITDTILKDKWEALDAIAAAGQSYYIENFSKTRVITKNGYLYNKAAEEKIDINYLVANGYLSSKYISVQAEVLLLNCDDFKNYDDFSIKSWETGLTVFAAMKHPSDNVYLLTTSKSSGGAITASKYAALLNSYYQNHGSVGRLYSDTEEYNRILNFISMYESKYENYYVRSIIADNKYAMVVLSGQSNVEDVKQYVLKRSGSIWEVVIDGLESDPRVIITINKELPDYNITMIPAYTINDFRGSISKDKGALTSEMTARGMISGVGDIKYISGTSNYCYILLKNEIKYICNYVGGRWNILQVASSDEARKKMLAISKNAPTFIILDR